MASDMKITIVEDIGGDWRGIYMDGELVDEGHCSDVETSRILDIVGVPHSSVDVDMGEADMSRLPKKVEDLPTKARMLRKKAQALLDEADGLDSLDKFS